jgi:phage tail P2-like protein
MEAWKMPSELQTTPLDALLPDSISGDPTIAAAASAIDPHLQAVTEALPGVLIYAGIDRLPVRALDLLAWQFDVDFWSPVLPVESKRNLIRGAIAWHRKKGTVWAIKKVLADVGVDAEIVQWHQPGGELLERFAFAVRGMIRRPLLPNEMWGPDTIAEVERAIAAAKNVRSWLGWLTLALEMDVPLDPLSSDLAQAVRAGHAVPMSFGPLFDRGVSGFLDESGIDQAPVARDETSAAWTMGRPWSLDMFYEEGSAGWIDQMVPGIEGDSIPPADLMPVVALAIPSHFALGVVATGAGRPDHRFFIDIHSDSEKNNSTSTAPAYFGADEISLDSTPGIDEVALDLCPLDALMEVAHA